MPKHDFLTPKAIANRQKSIGLQKLRWYCQMCQKQVYILNLYIYIKIILQFLMILSVEMKTDSNATLQGMYYYN